MGLLGLVGKAFGVKGQMEWIRQKEIMVLGPGHLGYHYFFVDANLNVALFFLKSDLKQYIYVGNPLGASEEYIFNERGKIDEKRTLSPSQMKWRLTKKNVRYNSEIIDPNLNYAPCKYIGYNEFYKEIDEEWIKSQVKINLKKMKEQN